MEQQHDFSEVLEVASIAGHILLENGAEISRVEDIMARISTYFGVDKGNFFVLSNGIFTTGSNGGKVEKAGGQASTYANVEFIPIRPIQLQKVVEVNQLSYDISAGKCSLEEARHSRNNLLTIVECLLFSTLHNRTDLLDRRQIYSCFLHRIQKSADTFQKI